MRKLPFIALTFTLAVTALTATAHADRFEVNVSTGTRWATADSVDALSGDDSHSQSGLGLALRLEGIRPFGFDLYVESNYDAGSISGTTFGRIDNDLSLHTVQFGGRLQKPVGKRTTAFARFTAGYTTGLLGLSDKFATTSRPTSDRAHAGTSTLGGGFSVALSRSKKLEIGLHTSLDYSRTTSLAFDAAPEDGDEGALTIPTTSASLGDVDISGWSFRLGAFARF